MQACFGYLYPTSKSLKPTLANSGQTGSTHSHYHCFITAGVLQIEAMAQLGGIVMLDPKDQAGKEQFFFGGIESCRFRRPVVPGDTLVSLSDDQELGGVSELQRMGHGDDRRAGHGLSYHRDTLQRLGRTREANAEKQQRELEGMQRQQRKSQLRRQDGNTPCSSGIVNLSSSSSNRRG